jgi:hypothetical protein
MTRSRTTLTREKLYELVWSEPRKTLGPKFGISDVRSRKICLEVNIPAVSRRVGETARRQEGQEGAATSSGPRDEGNRGHWAGQLLEQWINQRRAPCPSRPHFRSP